MTSQAIFGLVGTGGHGRETLPFARAHIAAHPELGIDRIVFVDREACPAVAGCPVISEAEFAAMDADRGFAVAIGKPETRWAVAERLEAAGCRARTIVAPSAIVISSARVAPGALIAHHALINADASVGRHLIANVHASVAHDCVIGDFVTLGPRACVNGSVRIGDGVEIGAGVAAGAVVVGNPAREIAR